MPEFNWQGCDRNGRKVKGVISAESKAKVFDELIQARIRPIQIRRVWDIGWLKRARNINDLQVTQLTRQLATLLQAGVPLFQALQVLSQTTSEPALRALIERLQDDLSQGLHFTQALQKHPEFDPLYCNLIAAAEVAGMLDSVLLQLAHHREKAHALKRQIRAALFYPSIVLMVAVAVLSLLLMFVVPSFEQIFSSFGAQLPWLTQTVIDISHHWFSWMSALLFIASGVRLLFKHQIQSHPQLQHRVDALWLQAPLIGRFIQQTCIARWTRTLATLFGAGIPLIQAISHLENITGNSLYQKATRHIHDQLLQGIALSQAITQHPLLFTPMLMQMSAIGEESGELDHMLGQVATHAENEVEQTVTYLSKLVEPAIMVILGVLVGGLVMALYLPIFEMGQVV